MRSKFTNQQLYSWMSSQLAGVYFRTYQLALDQEQRAERACRHELGLDDQNPPPFIQMNSWDSLKRGLLAGEHLYQDLQRLQSAYLERNVREFEITKNVSLLQLDPSALIRLRVTGPCSFDVPEVLFDRDLPGHYMRRITMVSLSIPCVVGPYTGVNATLQLTNHSTRISNSTVTSTGTGTTDPSYYPSKLYPTEEEDPRFTSAAGAVKAVKIVTSTAQQDSGMFEPNMRDERYLPFEGAGAISAWKLTLPQAFRPFDYDTISDVVLHIRYTSRYGDQLETECQRALQGGLNLLHSQSDAANGGGLARLFSLRQEFPTEWSRLVGPDGSGVRTQEFSIAKNRFPFLFSSPNITLSIKAGEAYSVPKPEITPTDFPDLKIYPPKAEDSVSPTPSVTVGDRNNPPFLQGVKFTLTTPVTVDPKEENAIWKLEAEGIDAFRKNVRDILVVLYYGISMPSQKSS